MSDTTVEGLAADQRTNGHSRTIEVQNPATGEVIASVPALEPADVAAVVERARAAQPGWAALGFEGRGRILKRAQKWVIDNADRIARTIVSENGKAYEDAQLAEVSYAAASFGFWAKNAPKYLADERIRSSSPFVMGRKLVVRYEPVGVAGVIGPWNYPLTNSFGDCIPALAAGNSAVLEAGQPHAAHLAADGRVPARVRPARGRVHRGARRGLGGRGADRRGGLRDVHGLHRGRQEGHGPRGADAHPGGPGAGRQGPDDRAGRREPRARRQRRGALLDAERRADLHLDRARLRRGSGVRRVRGQGRAEAAASCARARPGDRDRWTSAP